MSTLLSRATGNFTTAGTGYSLTNANTNAPNVFGPNVAGRCGDVGAIWSSCGTYEHLDDAIDWVVFGCTNQNVESTTTLAYLRFLGGRIYPESGFSTASDVLWDGGTLTCDNVGFDSAGVNYTSGIYPNTSMSVSRVRLNSCSILSEPVTASIASASNGARVTSATNYNQTAGDHRLWKRHGHFKTDTTFYRTAAPSLRMSCWSTNASNESLTPRGFNGGWLVPVQSGQSGQSVTVSVAVRKSVLADGTAYNGNQPKLVQSANYALGVTDNTIIATATNAANGAWEVIGGSTAAATAAGVFEFWVETSGTAGWVNVDDVSLVVG